MKTFTSSGSMRLSSRISHNPKRKQTNTCCLGFCLGRCNPKIPRLIIDLGHAVIDPDKGLKDICRGSRISQRKIIPWRINAIAEFFYPLLRVSFWCFDLTMRNGFIEFGLLWSERLEIEMLSNRSMSLETITPVACYIKFFSRDINTYKSVKTWQEVLY